MKGNIRDIVIGIAILAVVLGGIYLIRRQNTSTQALPTPTPVSQFEQSLKDRFNITVPDNVQKIDLKAVSSTQGTGLATRNFESGKFVFTALADLPDLKSGFYQVWIIRGNPQDPNYSILSLGTMRLAKGGFLLEYESNKDYSDYQNVVVSLEKSFVSTPSQHVLEGSF